MNSSPGLDGSPYRTAIFAPLGNTGGASPHLMSEGVSIGMGASARAIGAARLAATASGTRTSVRVIAPSTAHPGRGPDAPLRANAALWREAGRQGTLSGEKTHLDEGPGCRPAPLAGTGPLPGPCSRVRKSWAVVSAGGA